MKFLKAEEQLQNWGGGGGAMALGLFSPFGGEEGLPDSGVTSQKELIWGN